LGARLSLLLLRLEHCAWVELLEQFEIGLQLVVIRQQPILHVLRRVLDGQAESRPLRRG
jgi:hypothetical protein